MIIFTYCLLNACTNVNKRNDIELSIEPFTVMNLEDSIIHLQNINQVKSEYYLVSGFNNDSLQMDYLDSFVCDLKPFGIKRYHNFWIHLFRKSANTNNIEIAKNPRQFIRYSLSNDHLFTYCWRRSGTFRKEIYNLCEYPVQVLDSFKCKSIW